ncbi:hypothetical protein QJS04_geneDACA024288 [Acorus gramineus]|uniref:Small ribosomal subunit protein uS13m n=1 Tax=Acorus gramineus TaxID=55184 RepID=A0AAV9A3A1_ACOGR|nr:hypothetical protein QJS04_geneDACA024288 [Acorus gramineus]
MSCRDFMSNPCLSSGTQWNSFKPYQPCRRDGREAASILVSQATPSVTVKKKSKAQLKRTVTVHQKEVRTNAQFRQLAEKIQTTKFIQRMSYLSGALNKKNEQVRIALTKIYGIGPKKAMQLCSRLGLSGNIKMNELTKFQMDQIDERIGQDHVVHWELQRVLLADIEQLISIGCYRGTKKRKSV